MNTHKKYAVPEMMSGRDIKAVRQILELTQSEFAELVNVSKKTVERWESGKKPVTGPVVTLAKVLGEYPQMEAELEIPAKTMPLRLWYMYKNTVCTIIDVDERKKDVRIYNFTRNDIMRAFGRNTHPDFGEYEEFLESRCFPRSRDKMKLMLRELDLPFYDPFMIIEKTQGRMAEDDFWIQIER